MSGYRLDWSESSWKYSKHTCSISGPSTNYDINGGIDEHVHPIGVLKRSTRQVSRVKYVGYDVPEIEQVVYGSGGEAQDEIR